MASIWSRIGQFARAAMQPGSGANRWVSLAGDLAGSLAKGREAGRLAETAALQQEDLMRLQGQRSYEDALMDRARLDLDRRAFEEQQRQNAWRDTLRSALALNMKDAAFTRPAGVPRITFSGGARPSALGDDARTGAEILNARALVTLMDGPQFEALPEPERFTPSERPRVGFLDHLLGGIGVVGGVADRQAAQAAADERESFVRRLLEEVLRQRTQQAPVSPGVDAGLTGVPSLPPYQPFAGVR